MARWSPPIAAVGQPEALPEAETMEAKWPFGISATTRHFLRAVLVCYYVHLETRPRLKPGCHFNHDHHD